MISTAALTPELQDAGRALGLIAGDGSVDETWFAAPQARLRTILSSQPQREALLRLLDGLLPPAPLDGLPPGERWHPLLGDRRRGNLYLTVAGGGAGAVVGLAGEVSTDAASPAARLRARLGLAGVSGSSLRPLAGTADGPLQVELAVELGWRRPAQAIGLGGVTVTVTLAPLAAGGPAAGAAVRLRGLDLGQGARDALLDPEHLGAEGFQLVTGLIQQVLSELAAPVGEAAAAAHHLLPLLGLGADGIPPLPVADLARGPAALRDWLTRLTQGPGTPPAVAWLGHLAGLLGAAAPAVSGSGTPADPWRVAVLPVGAAAGSALELTLARDASLRAGVRLVAVPSGPSPAARLEAEAVLAAIPLAGTGAAVVLPSAAFGLRAPGDPLAGALVSAPDVRVGDLRAGLAWSAGALRPLLELVDVGLAGTAYERVDLTDAGSVVAAAAGAVRAAIMAALGSTGAGAHLAALAGLVAPAGDPASPHRADLALLASSPARAIAGMHRAVLLDPLHPWSHLLEEIAGLLGAGGPAAGSGTADDPWRVGLDTGSPLKVELAAWNAQASGGAADPQQLRLGLRARAGSAPLQVTWLATLLAFDLPQSGPGTVGVMGDQRCAVLAEPLPAAPALAGVGLRADRGRAAMAWSPGRPMAWRASVESLRLDVDGAAVNLGTLAFPAAGFDVTSPAATAAAMGVSVGDLESALRGLLARASLEWGGMPGFVLAGLLGAHARLPGLSPGWPVLADPAGPGSLLSDPLAALRAWLGAVSAGLAADGAPLLPEALPWLRSLLAGALPDVPDAGPLAFQAPVGGSGTYDDPWTLPVADRAAPSLEGLLWLEPGGPPQGWAGALAGRAAAAADLPSLLGAARDLAAFVPGLPAGLFGRDLDELASGLSGLEAHLAGGDGVVPTAAQVPTSGSWATGATIAAAHHRLPSDPSAIAQALAQVDAWAGGGARAVLLLGPAFADHTAWAALLASPLLHGTTDPAANFDFRAAAGDPALADLSGVTASVDHYTADLADDGTGSLASLTAQVGRAVDRIRALRGAVPVTLVAHSTAGLAARAFTAASPGLVRGLVTLGTPHGGAPLPFLADAGVADAARFAQALRPGMQAASPLRDALDGVLAALDGFRPPAAPGQVPVAAPFPAGSFGAAASADTGGRPALALAAAIPGTLRAALGQSLATLAGAAAAPAPTHLAAGLRWRPALPAGGGVDVQVRAAAGRVRLRDGVAEPARPAFGLSVRAVLTGAGGWLVGGPGAAVRVRWAELGADLAPGAPAAPRLALYDAGWRAPNALRVGLGDPQARQLLGAVLQAVAVPTPGPDTAVGALVGVLQALGVAAPDPHGGAGLSLDAFDAITTDAAGFLGPRLQGALAAAGPLLGLSGPPAGPWTAPLPDVPFTVTLSASPWSLRLAGSQRLGRDAALDLSAGLALPGFAPALDATLSIGSARLSWSQAARRLTLAAPPWLESLALRPRPAPAALAAALNDVLPRLLFSSAASALLRALLGPGYRLGPIDSFFAHPADWLLGDAALGLGGALSSDRLTRLLGLIAGGAGLPAGPGLGLPSGLRLTAAGDPATLTLGTATPLGGVLQAQLTAALDPLRHLHAGGTLELDLPLPGTWGAVKVALAAGDAGATLTVTPQGGAPIQLLPTFSGLGALAGGAAALLPALLDALVAKLRLGAPKLLPLALGVAGALDLHDAGTGFAGHAAQLQALAGAGWQAAIPPARRAAAAAAIEQLFTAGSPLNGTLPGTVALDGQVVTWTFTLAAPDAGTITARLGWDGSGPVAALSAAGVKLGNGALLAALEAGYAGGGLRCSASLAAQLASSLGLEATPELRVDVSGGGFGVRLLPLAKGAADGSLTIELAPAPGVQGAASTALDLVREVLAPLVAQALFQAARGTLASRLWAAGPTVEDALVAAGIVDRSGVGPIPDRDSLRRPLPDLPAMVAGLLTGLAGAGPSVALTPTLSLGLVSGAGMAGLRLSGSEHVLDSPLGLDLVLGAPSAWGAGLDRGAALYLFQVGGGAPRFKPVLELVGVGVRLSGEGDSPLVDTSGFRLGAARGVAFMRVDLSSGVRADSFGAGVELDRLGLPLGLATGGNLGGDNPVAASLLRSDGGAGGDPHPVSPALDVAAWQWNGPAGDGQFHVTFQGGTGPIWIGVHSAFGPIYVDQVGLELTPDPGVGLLIDGSVKVDGLTAQADELTVTVPFRALASPGRWRLDLKGLGLGFQAPGVTIAGGLLKNDRGPAVEYDGMLLVQITEFGFVAVGAYSRPQDAGGGYTSLFVFVAAFVLIGLPPIIEISGFGLGVGYNRELVPPTDLNQIDRFILIAALDGGGALANDPMGELMRIGGQMPARRGSFWLAVGLRGTSFVIVNVIAVVYVALDRGLEIGLLGVARMALPSDDSALVSVELALKARFSTAEGILSIQAQLTDNSWLLSRDCQLTGGFAYFMWFPQSQFLLTLGGYHPAFAKPPQFPDVPRLGYHWSIFGAITMKGESYFALTNTCVMAGARMEVTYGPSAIHVWFTAHADFLVSWDPFHYDAEIGVAVGAEFHMEICFIECADIDISVSLGASLHVLGPPLHGEVKVDLAVASVTVAFGPKANPRPDFITDFGAFARKYLFGGDPAGSAVAVHLLTGMLPPSPPGGQPAPGTADQPWPLATELSFQTETRMPALRYRDFVEGPGPRPDVRSIDIAPMNKQHVDAEHVITLEGADGTGGWRQMSPAAADPRFKVDPGHFRVEGIVGQVSEATWHVVDPVPAAARTVPVLTGVRITGFAVASGRSLPIPIAKLVDDGSPRPLPFAVAIDLGRLRLFGGAADELAALAAALPSHGVLGAAASLLAGDSGVFADARQSAGLSRAGLQPLASRALLQSRSAPPLLAPITTGLTMRPVGLERPPRIAAVAQVGPVALESPRLRAVLQGRPQPVSDAPPSARFTVARVAGPAVPRVRAPAAPPIAGARLHRAPAAAAPRPTAAARSGRTLRSPELGWAAGALHARAFGAAPGGLAGDGVAVTAGTTHVWDLPPGHGMALEISGQAAARVTFLSSGGVPLRDMELVPGEGRAGGPLPVPDGAGMVAVACLGSLPAGVAAPAPGPGAVSLSAAPQGGLAVAGWQSASLVPQVGRAALLARGACVVLAGARAPLRARVPSAQAAVTAAEVIGDQTGVETWLPPGVEVVMVLLDQQGPTAADAGDLAIAVEGATLATPPLRVAGGRRRALLYDVAGRAEGAERLAVSVASQDGWRLAGVLGLAGRAREWAARMNGGVPEHLVPDGPLTPDGQVLARLVPQRGGPQ